MGLFWSDTPKNISSTELQKKIGADLSHHFSSDKRKHVDALLAPYMDSEGPSGTQAGIKAQEVHEALELAKKHQDTYHLSSDDIVKLKGILEKHL